MNVKRGKDLRTSGIKRKANSIDGGSALVATADAAANLLHAECKESILKAISKLPVN